MMRNLPVLFIFTITFIGAVIGPRPAGRSPREVPPEGYFLAPYDFREGFHDMKEYSKQLQSILSKRLYSAEHVVVTPLPKDHLEDNDRVSLDFKRSTLTQRFIYLERGKAAESTSNPKPAMVIASHINPDIVCEGAVAIVDRFAVLTLTPYDVETHWGGSRKPNVHLNGFVQVHGVPDLSARLARGPRLDNTVMTNPPHPEVGTVMSAYQLFPKLQEIEFAAHNARP